MDYPITEGKGLEGQNCNRTACQEPNSAHYYNTGTKAYYCLECAMKINRSALRDGYDLFPGMMTVAIDKGVQFRVR